MARAFAAQTGFETTFTGYETVEQPTAVGAVAREDGRVLVKLVESPFYATGGGQIADSGVVECEGGDCRARVAEGKPVWYLVPDGVVQYVTKRRLYLPEPLES